MSISNEQQQQLFKILDILDAGEGSIINDLDTLILACGAIIHTNNNNNEEITREYILSLTDITYEYLSKITTPNLIKH